MNNVNGGVNHIIRQSDNQEGWLVVWKSNGHIHHDFFNHD